MSVSLPPQLQQRLLCLLLLLLLLLLVPASVFVLSTVQT
jgi:hypothetical protein